jgi:hypothetical protein
MFGTAFHPFIRGLGRTSGQPQDDGYERQALTSRTI